MTPKEVRVALREGGYAVNNYSSFLVENFCEELKDCQYGSKETASAFCWFKTGWEAAARTAPNSVRILDTWKQQP